MQTTFTTKAYGKNDIRGLYPEEVNAELFYYTGIGYVNWALENLREQGNPKTASDLYFSVCMDARLHSPDLKKSLISGIRSTGANVLDIGLAPTPLGYYSEFAILDKDFINGGKIYGALIVTASHNPKEYNGLKMTFNKASLNEAQIKEVKAKCEKAYADKDKIGNYVPPIGLLVEKSLIPHYIDKLASTFGKIGSGIKVVVDSANATGGIVAPELYKALGAEVIELYSEPDGNFPNHHPNPSVLSTLETLQKTVVENKADIGIAFDGDSDRIGAVTSDGSAITGDKLLFIYAMDLIKELAPRGEVPTVVSEVKCSQVLYDEINANGGNAVMYKTGHGYIKSKMKETGALLAGEMSGHTFFKDRYFGYDDAIYAGCRLIEIIAKNKTQNKDFNLLDILEPFNKYKTSGEVRLHCPNELKIPVLEEFTKMVDDELFGSKIREIITIDGLRIVFDDGLAIIRKSNTEPVFTMGFEATTQEKCDHYTNTMIDEIEKLIKAKS